MVKDIWLNSGASNPFALKNVNGTLFFSADNGTKGAELWKSDGTAAGTVLVKDVWPGATSGAIGNFSKVLNKLIFTGNDGVNGYKTWESDGSDAGTAIATEIGSPDNGDMREVIETDYNIFASISETDIGRELWAVSYSSILPLDLLEFKGRLVNNDGILNWKTGNEINIAEFGIERSLNGNSFISVGNVNAANIPGIHNYTFTDANITDLGTDIVYYRLKQRDIDGRYTYSKVISISIKNATGITLYPNPAVAEVYLTVVAPRKEKMDYQFFDNAGRIVMQETTQVLAGTNRFSVDINRLPAGVYYIKLNSNSINKKLQFVKH